MLISSLLIICHLAQEVSTLARCQSENITQYYASVLKPGTSELLIVMELMAASVADLVRTSRLRPSACHSTAMSVSARSHQHCRIIEHLLRALTVGLLGVLVPVNVLEDALQAMSCSTASWVLGAMTTAK